MKNSSAFAHRSLLALALVLAFLPLSVSGQRRSSGSAQRTTNQSQPQGGAAQGTAQKKAQQRSGQRNVISGNGSNGVTETSSPAGSRAASRNAQRTAATATTDAAGTETAPAEGETPATTTPAPRGRTRPGGNATFNAAALAGSYVATTTGVSGGRGSAAADAFIRGSKGGQSSGQLAGTQLLINIDHFLNESEQAQLEQAAQNGKLASVLSQFNCGSVTIGNAQRPITVNAAISAQSAKGTVIYLLSEQAFSTQGAQGRSGGAGAVGMIEMRLAPASASGKGSMYTTAQVGFNNGAVIVRGGASTATQLTIAKQ